MEQPEPNYFRELLGVLTEEELIRFRHRLEKAGNLRIAEVLTDTLVMARIGTQRSSSLQGPYTVTIVP